MAFSLLWSSGLIVSIIVFAIAFGLTLSNMDISKKYLAMFAVASMIITFIVTYILDIFKIQLNAGIGIYNYLILFLIAFVLMFVGYLINEGENYKINYIKIFSLTYLCFMLTVVICMCSKESLLGLNSWQISAFTAVLFAIIMILTCIASQKFNLIGNSYKSLGSMYFIVGIYFLAVSLFLPNIISLNMADMKPINVVSLESIAITVALLVVVVVLGLFYYKKNTLLK